MTRRKETHNIGNPDTPAKKKPTPSAAAQADKQRQAVELRLSGATFAQIAEHLGMTGGAGGAHKLVQRALIETVRPGADDLREVEAARLDRLLLAVWPDALDGDLKAVAQARGLIEQRSRLLGLNMPTKVDLDATVSVDPQEIEIVRRIREWRAGRETT